ncbi:transcriptional regulator BetI [Colwellia chukchiensis]|nr:transcriptional regulator BetI [Colwellia chukchiensis]
MKIMNRVASSTSPGARLTPDERRAELIDAVLRCIMRDGHLGLSVRTVCQEAGVSAGLLAHHFNGKEELIKEAYRKLTKDLFIQLLAILDEASEPVAQLRLYVDSFFRPPMLDKDYLKVWLGFWSLSQQKAEIATLRNEVNSKYVKILEQLITQSINRLDIPNVNARLAAFGLSALMDGLWLEWSLNPKSFSPEEANQICQCWVDSLIAGELKRIR